MYMTSEKKNSSTLHIFLFLNFLLYIFFHFYEDFDIFLNILPINFPDDLDLENSAVYLDFWAIHWCPYYNDRSYLFSSRVNEL